jgi:uncharacterized protein
MRFLKSEAGALVLWLLASALLAALLTPHLYDAGKTFAASAQANDYPSLLESIGKSAQKARPDRYYSRCLLISALAFLPFLIRRVNQIPDQGNRADFALIKQSWKQRGTQLLLGLTIGVVSLGTLALFLHFTGASEPNGKAISYSKIFSKALVPALGAGFIEEWLFRGLLLGLWMRACSLNAAWIGSSLMFSFLHFLKPAKGIDISDPYAWHAGLEILNSTLSHFAEPAFFITEFAALTFFGMILAYSRIRSRSLCFAIGLHAGLVLALKTFTMTQVLIPSSPLHPWFIGADLKSGLLPLVALGFCMIACVYTLRKRSLIVKSL